MHLSMKIIKLGLRDLLKYYNIPKRTPANRCARQFLQEILQFLVNLMLTLGEYQTRNLLHIFVSL